MFGFFQSGRLIWGRWRTCWESCPTPTCVFRSGRCSSVNRSSRNSTSKPNPWVSLLFVASSNSSHCINGASETQCEVLVRCSNRNYLDVLQSSTGTSVSTSTTSTKADQQHMCQPLIDAVAQHVQHPMLNHTLNRTFGPAIQALHGTPIRYVQHPCAEPHPQPNVRPCDTGAAWNTHQVCTEPDAEPHPQPNVRPSHTGAARNTHQVCTAPDAEPHPQPNVRPCDTGAARNTHQVHYTGSHIQEGIRLQGENVFLMRKLLWFTLWGTARKHSSLRYHNCFSSH